ncbi:MAG: Na+-translocating decarboxylase subunit beta [Azospirillum sp.]|nr:Na+-translocating decarboxylase subunit beta [Azospirillum sp.]
MDIDPLMLFQGVATLAASEPQILIARIFLVCLGMLLMYLGHKGILEALLMIPMGLGMATVNVSVLFFEGGKQGTLFVDPLITTTEQLMSGLQIYWLQPIYTLTFSNGLIACLVFMGIGVLLDVGFVMARPFQSMFLALCAELGTVIVYPLGMAFGLSEGESAAVATIGGADGPMVLFTSLLLAKNLFVPIAVVAYLYLGLTYGGYPFLIKLMVPKRLRAIEMPYVKTREVKSSEKMLFAIIACVLLCFLFPVAAPLFFSVFLGIIVRESGLVQFADLLKGPVLYGATFFLGLLLGILCEARTILDPDVLITLVLGVVALLFSGIGGILGGYILYFWTGGKFNPVIGIAGVSCVPTTAKVAQKIVSQANPDAIVLPIALGANISGVITSAILAGILITVVK